MSRPLVKMGLPGDGQQTHAEQALEYARSRMLYEGELLILRNESTKEGGALKETFVPEDDAVRGRIDPTSSNTAGVLRGDALRDESSEHLITFDDAVEITTKDRIRAMGKDWIITSLRERTGKMVTRVEARYA